MKIRHISFLFIFVLIIVSFYYRYDEILFKKPQSIHKWRQSDCASIALNYYQNGMKFFTPETHNLTSDSGTSGVCCTSEIPVLYFSVAALYSVFGYHDSIYRLFNTLLFFLGLFFLFRMIHYLLNDVFWSIALSIVFFTSPVLVYYGNNYLSNSSALAFSIIGWYYFMRFFFENRNKHFYISMFVFFIAAAFKVTALFSLIAITGFYLIELTGLVKGNNNQKLFSRIKFVVTVVFVFIVIGLWLVYAHVFNQKHDCYYFSTTIFPIWNLDKESIYGVLHNVKNIWLYQYFHKSVLLFLFICFLLLAYFYRKCNKLFLISVLIICSEVITYILLQFWTFADHDYYTIDIYILPILIVITLFDVLKRHYLKIFSSKILKIAFSVFLLFNIYYAQKQINERYYGWMNDFSKNRDLYTIKPYLRQIGIFPTDTIISIPDGSHASLYLMNQKGWTEYTDTRFNVGKSIRYNQDSAGIQHSVDKGAKYLILNGIEELFRKPYLQAYCTNLKGKYKNVLVFNLRSNTRNFNFKDKIVLDIYKCNAEMLSEDLKCFLSDNKTAKFENGDTRSKEFSYKGSYSSKLNNSLAYGMTIKFNKLKMGEIFLISVWRKTNKQSKGDIIASSNSPNPFYKNDYKIIETDNNGWEKIQMDLFVSEQLANQELVIYVYNPNHEPVYFDDFEIIRYNSIFEK